MPSESAISVICIAQEAAAKARQRGAGGESNGEKRLWGYGAASPQRQMSVHYTVMVCHQRGHSLSSVHKHMQMKAISLSLQWMLWKHTRRTELFLTADYSHLKLQDGSSGDFLHHQNENAFLFPFSSVKD